MQRCLVLIVLAGCAPAPVTPPSSVSFSSGASPRDGSAGATGTVPSAAEPFAPRTVREPLWVTGLQTHAVVAVGDALQLWSSASCEVRTVDAKTGATRSTVAVPRDIHGNCTCTLESNALGCFHNRGFSVHRPSDAKSLFFRPRKDSHTGWSFESGVGLFADTVRGPGGADSFKFFGIDPTTGTDLWSAPLPARGRLVASRGDNALVVYERPGGSGVTAFEPRTGTELWQKEYAAPPSHVVALDDHAFVVGGTTIQLVDRSTGAAIGAAFPNPSPAAPNPRVGLAVRPSGTDLVFEWVDGQLGTTVLATDRSGHERWRHTTASYTRSVAASSERVLLQIGQDELRALDAATGAVAWRWFVRAHQFHLANPKLLVVTVGDTTYGLDLTTDLPQHEMTVQGHVDVRTKDPRAILVTASDTSIAPDPQGNFTLRLRGRGAPLVRADIAHVPRTGNAAKGAPQVCAVGSGAEIDLAKPPPPLVLSVTDEPCNSFGY